MITEDYCSYEVAKLLKEKGFDEDCRAYYDNGKFSWVWNDGISRNTDNERYVSCPTTALAMKWLRVKYVIIFILPCKDDIGNFAYCYDIALWNEEEGIFEMNNMSSWFYTYKQAVEAALKYSLENLI